MEKELQTENIMVSEETVKNLIFTVRNQQVMLDSDLANLYQVEEDICRMFLRNRE